MATREEILAEIQRRQAGTDQITREDVLAEIKRRQATEDEYTIGEKAMGLGEVLGTVLTGIPATIAGGATGFGTLVGTDVFGEGEDPDAAEFVMRGTQEAGTYVPRTKAGQEFLGDFSEMLL